MFRIVFLLLTGIVMGLAAQSAAPAAAFPALDQPLLQAEAASPSIIAVKHRGRSHGDYFLYKRHRHYDAPRYRHHRHYDRYPRHYYRYNYVPRCYGWDDFYCRPWYGYYNGDMWWDLDLDLTPDRRGYSSRHVAWCKKRYRSYNVRTNTWVAYSGRVRQCISPYGP